MVLTLAAGEPLHALQPLRRCQQLVRGGIQDLLLLLSVGSLHPVQNGQSPFAALWDSGRTMLAGLLLIIPGVLSDVLALILLLLPNKSGRISPRNDHDDGIIEGEVRVVDARQIESKSGSQ